MRRKFLVGFVVAAGVASLLALWRPAFPATDKAEDAQTRTAEAGQKSRRRAKLDVNLATAHDLAGLPGVSSELAERIIQNRPYRKLDDLVTRKVLGKKEFARIREFIVIRRAR